MLDKNLKIIIKLVSISLISILFIVSGIHKIFSFNDTVESLKSKLPIDKTFAQVLIILAILFVFIGPLLIGLSIILHNSLLLKFGSLILILFVLLVTPVYHPPSESSQLINFLKNLALIGGLSSLLIVED